MAKVKNKVLCKCGDIIPEKRVGLGYKVCVRCSSVQPYGCIDVTYHKTGNTIQIMDKEKSALLRKKSARRGYGTNLKNISS